MSEAHWSEVDRYFDRHLGTGDEILRDALRRSAEAGLPDIAVAPNQGRLLKLMAEMCGARRILEVGTLGGYSTIWLARALPPDGRLVTLEIDPAHAGVARENVAAAGLADRVEVRLGDAREGLATLRAEGAVFDFAFLDAEKSALPDHFEATLAMSHPGTVMVFDNVVRGGRVVDAGSGNAAIEGVRRLVEMLGAEPRVEALALQTVGTKGHDGFAMARVVG